MYLLASIAKNSHPSDILIQTKTKKSPASALCLYNSQGNVYVHLFTWMSYLHCSLQGESYDASPWRLGKGVRKEDRRSQGVCVGGCLPFHRLPHYAISTGRVRRKIVRWPTGVWEWTVERMDCRETSGAKSRHLARDAYAGGWSQPEGLEPRVVKGSRLR